MRQGDREKERQLIMRDCRYHIIIFISWTDMKAAIIIEGNSTCAKWLDF